MSPPKDMVSLKDVAQRAGVSLMTVSRAINYPEQLKPDTLQRVQQAIASLNYVPDFSARKIRNNSGKKVSTLGVLSLDTATTPFSVEILLSIEDTAREFGWAAFFVNLTSNEDDKRTINHLLAQRPDGIIYTSMGLRQVIIPELLKDQNLVLANCITKENNFPAYVPNDFDGQYQAVRKAIEMGYRRPLCFYLPEAAIASQCRRSGAELAWREAGLPPQDLRQFHMENGDEHYPDVVPFIEQHCPQNIPDFDLLICGNDRIAFLAYQVLLTKGIAIPQQVAVLGYDNLVGIGDLFLPPLTTVQLPHQEIGREAVLHLIEGRKSTGIQTLCCPLLVRQSM